MADDIGPFAGLPGIFAGAFGEPVEYRPAAGGTLSITGIYLMPYAPAVFDDTSIEGYAPELHVRGEDVTPEQGDELTVRGAAFRVADVQPDGKGMIKLSLHERDG